MNFLNNIKLKYTSDLLNQSIEKNEFSNFQKHYEVLKKLMKVLPTNILDIIHLIL